MRRLLPLALLLSIPIVLSACGGGGKPSTVSQQVPAAGATVTLGDQVTLKVPPGALPDATKVTITRKDTPGDALAGGQSLGAGYNIDLGGQTLAKPVTLEIAFDPKKLPQDSPGETAFAAYHDDTTNSWVPVGGTVETQRNVIVIQTDHLSWWNPFSWNWEAWIAVLHDGLSAKLSNWVSGLQLLTGTCNKSGQHVTVDDSKANSILQGCVATDDPASPQLRVVNLKSFYVGISPAQGGPGYPHAEALGPGESAPFTASTADQPPATVYADFTEPVMWRFIVGLCVEMLPGGDQIPNEGLAFVADGLQRVMSAQDVSTALAHGDPRAAAEGIYGLITGQSFIETFARLAAQYGQQHGINMLKRWTQSGVHTALLGLAATDAIFSETDFIANNLLNDHSQLAFSWTQPPTPRPTSTLSPLPTSRPETPAGPSPTPSRAQLTGPWALSIDVQTGQFAGVVLHCSMSLTQNDSHISGAMDCGPFGTGTFSGEADLAAGTFSFNMYFLRTNFYVSGSVSATGETLSGNWSTTVNATGTFTATRS